MQLSQFVLSFSSLTLKTRAKYDGPTKVKKKRNRKGEGKEIIRHKKTSNNQQLREFTQTFLFADFTKKTIQRKHHLKLTHFATKSKFGINGFEMSAACTNVPTKLIRSTGLLTSKASLTFNELNCSINVK